MFKVLLLICLSGMPRADCTIHSAESVIQGPEVGSSLMCGFHGQAYLAQTALAMDLTDGRWLKLVCRRSGIQQVVG